VSEQPTVPRQIYEAAVVAMARPGIIDALCDNHAQAAFMRHVLDRICGAIRERGEYELRGTLPEMFPSELGPNVPEEQRKSFEDFVRPYISTLRNKKLPREAVFPSCSPHDGAAFSVALIIKTPEDSKDLGSFRGGHVHRPYALGVSLFRFEPSWTSSIANEAYRVSKQNPQRQRLIEAGLLAEQASFASPELGMIWRLAIESVGHLRGALQLPIQARDAGGTAFELMKIVCFDLLSRLEPPQRNIFLYLSSGFMIAPSLSETESRDRSIVEAAAVAPHPNVAFDDEHFRHLLAFAPGLRFEEKLDLMCRAGELTNDQVGVLLDFCDREYRRLLALDEVFWKFVEEHERHIQPEQEASQSARSAFDEGKITKEVFDEVRKILVKRRADEMDQFLADSLPGVEVLIRAICQKQMLDFSSLFGAMLTPPEVVLPKKRRKRLVTPVGTGRRRHKEPDQSPRKDETGGISEPTAQADKTHEQRR